MEDIPRGIEVLVKKASVDPAFKKLLLEKRADAAKTIDLKLESPEIAMINAVPKTQLESIISRTIVLPRQRKVFLGKVAALMIVALGTAILNSGCPGTGAAPDRPEIKNQEKEKETHELLENLLIDHQQPEE